MAQKDQSGSVSKSGGGDNVSKGPSREASGTREGGSYEGLTGNGTASIGGVAQSLGTPAGGGPANYLDVIDPPVTAPTTTTPVPTAAEQALAALTRAQQYGSQQIADRGLNQGLIDQYGIMDAYNALLTQKQSDLGSGASDYANYGAQNLFDDALAAGENRYRTDLRNNITSKYGDGFEYNTFADTSDDVLLQSFLDAQKSDAQLVVDRAKARGQLNDVGYTRAVNDLNTQGSGGMSTLQSLGGGVLADYRKQLTTARDNGLKSASTASFQTPFNSQSVVDRLNSLKTDLSGRMNDDITKAVGGTSFFTPNTSIGKGGTVQGTINPSKINFADNPLLEAFQTDNARRAYGNNTGSLANTGTF